MTEHKVEIRALLPTDERTKFRSGNIELDRFFQRFAGQNQFRHHIGVSYVAIMDEGVVGYVTLSSGEIAVEDLTKTLKKRLPNYPLPILRMARLAIDERYQGLGLGKQLLKTVFHIALQMRDQSGCVGVVVDAKVEAVEFYKRYGFVELELISGELGDRPQPVSLFLPIKSIQQAISL
ncbi:MAG: Acetyltransferase (GNAT) domain-containing protein [uncultured Thiotrichaceae bacterium]|uniref:Acetyltransferase (GNAT) domain-containing protein n=1 Tax=uncultured Thiotrichaceae bacterium TaxID=298394 RepID=A0A6S6TY69_9GAMM|nr:MAG: Acetyltransferase (GNAT) domain-containing protein [uncultured Thiotrichaceae bacterium]